MNVETLWAILAVAAVIVAAALGVMAVVLLLLARDLRRLTRQAHATAAELERTVALVPARLERLDRLADEAEETLIALRSTIAAADSIVRGPADVVEGAKRTAENVGKGIVSGAGRLRRRIAGQDEAVGE